MIQWSSSPIQTIHQAIKHKPNTTRMTTVHVVIYNPTVDCDPCHWALWLNNDSARESIILQVGDDKGGVGYYIEKLENKKPEHSTKFKEAILCGTIVADKHKHTVLTIESHPVDNESTTWNCQAWVMEGLQVLVNEGLLKMEAGCKKTLESKRQDWQ
jgi:hypothetical protein